MLFSFGVFLLAIMLFILLCVSSFLIYKRRYNIKYSIKNMFPFELTYKTLFKDNIYTYIFLTLFSVTSIWYFVTFDLSYSDGYLIFTSIAGTIASIILLLLFVIPLTNLRAHTILSVLFFVADFSSTGAILMTALRSNHEYSQPLKIVTIVLSIILIVVGFSLIFNPRLTLDIRAKESVNEQGEKIMVRPKWVLYAFTEWCYIFIFLGNLTCLALLNFCVI